MTRSTAAFRLALAFASAAGPLALATPVGAQDPTARAESVQDEQLYTVEELDNLLAPVALYPDPILAQLLIAATYPDQVQLAARYVATYGTAGIDDQAWDVSVKSIARYEPVLNMLAERPNWATAVGRAYALQPGDVMASVQSLRHMARQQGNLVTTPEQRVEVEREAIRIVPAQPTVIYVPVYDPQVIYYRPVNYFSVRTPYWSFGIGYPIGGWLGYDLDWSTRVVYYHGWESYGGRHSWFDVSRPYISFSSIYYSPRRTIVVINRNIVRRHVTYDGFDRYNVVHRRTSWDRRDLPGRGGDDGRYRKSESPDRYGIPSRRDAGVYKPDKRDEDRGAVPRVGNTAPRGDNGGAAPSRGGNGGSAGGRPNVPGDRPGNGGNGNRPGDDNGRGNGGGRGNGAGNGGGNGGNSGVIAGGDRVKPIRAGGSRQPLYPPTEDIAPDRSRGASVPRRETATGEGDGTWNARPSVDREPSYKPSRSEPRAAPVPRDGSYGVPTDRSRAGSIPRSEPRYEPRSEPRSQPRSEPRYEPRAEPRSEPRYEPRSVPRANTERSMPRAEPRSEPRMEPRSVPRVERNAEPRSVPRASEPRPSAPRQSEPRASSPRGERPAPSAPNDKGRRSRGEG